MTYNLIVDGMKGIIEAHNQTYNYKNKEYTGAIFTITLPLS
jgi:K+-sensing histidine kinase KdpD